MFANLLHNQSNISAVQDLLEGLLTPSERKEIEQRIKIVKLMKANMTHHEIAAKLNVGIATVTRGSRELKQGRFSQIKPNRNAWRISQI
jgi:TrpR family trp operon transcriptional repressor